MAIFMGSCRFLESPLPPSSHWKLARRRRAVPAMASVQGESRRALLLVGISVLPLLHLKAAAANELIGARRMARGRSRGVSLAVREQERDKCVEKSETSKGNLGNQEAEDPKQQKEISVQESNPPELRKQDIGNLEAQSLEVQESNPPEVRKQDIGNLEAQSLEVPGKEILSQETNQPEQKLIKDAAWNPFISVLNELGIICSGVLGALYATSQKDKTVMETSIESMKAELTEKEAAATLLKENFEAKLLNEQEERRKERRRLQEEEASLSAQLASANETVSALHQELQSEKYLSEELKTRINKLEHAIVQSGEDKKMIETKLKEKVDTIDVLQDKISLLSIEINDKEKSIENLNSSLVEKESEFKNLSSVVVQTKSDLAEANSTLEKLRVELSKSREELASDKSSINSLNEKIKSLHAEKTETDQRLHDLVKEYNDLMSSSERERAVDSELLSKKEDEIQELEEKLRLALSEARAKQEKIIELTKEKDHVKALLEKEVNDMETMKADHKFIQDALGASRFEASNLSEELEEAKRSYKELTSRVSDIQNELHESKKLLHKELDMHKSRSKALSEELESITDVLEKTKEELGATSNKLNAAMEDRESLKKELLEIYKKVETITQELKEERKLVATLTGQYEALGNQMLMESEARKALEADLDEATISLGEMNKSALLLAKELEDSHSRISSLESEKGVLLKSLIEQKNLSKEAKENIEDAHKLITQLGGEREILDKRSRKYEEELTAAKGEILRMRRKINTRREYGNDVPEGTPFGVKKMTGKRRKGGSLSEDS